MSESYRERKHKAVIRQLENNRRLRFVEFLGEDCGYIDSLVANPHISPYDAKDLLDKGMPKELIPKFLLDI